jgi:hypothetical protein
MQPTVTIGPSSGSSGEQPPFGRRGSVLVWGLLLASLALLMIMVAIGVHQLVPNTGKGGPFPHHKVFPSLNTAKGATWVAAILAGVAVLAGLRAVQDGWRPSPRLLLVLGAVATLIFVVLPPAGSTDVLNYSMYGRIADLGHNPFVMTPQQLHRLHDPVAWFRPTAWKNQPSVYGPVAVGMMWMAAMLGGTSVAWIIFWIKAFNGMAFLLTGLVLDRIVAGDRSRRIRAALLWTLNPLMLFWVVCSGHCDVVGVLPVVLALWALKTFRDRAPVGAGLVAGALSGLAIAVKVSFGAPCAALLVTARRRPKVLAALMAGGAVLLAAIYLPVGRGALRSMSSRLDHHSDVFWPIPHFVQAHQTLFTGTTAIAMIVMAGLMLWRFPAPHPDLPDARLALVLALASVLASPFQYAWYDAIFFPLLALMPASRLDWLLVARCAVVSGIVLPGVTNRDNPYAVARIVVPIITIVFIAATLYGDWFPGQRRRGLTPRMSVD